MVVPKRYNKKNIKRVLGNPLLLVKEFRRLISHVIYPLNNLYLSKKYEDGIDVMSEDWDNLIILDACRYDYFKSRNHIDGKLEPVLSRGSHSYEFMKGNFIGRELHDTVYVTANPHAPKIPNNVFYNTKIILDQYMKPGAVIEQALEAHQKYPNKRLIVHIMPPHRPHLGQTADNLRDKFNLKDWESIDASESEESDTTGRPIWNLAIHNEIPVNKLRDAYQETLDTALNHADELAESLDGKTVITSDHGELLGERAVPLTHRRYGHPHEVDCRTLRIVPWLEIDGKIRRKVVAESPTEQEDIDDNTVNNRLVALGYKPDR